MQSTTGDAAGQGNSNVDSLDEVLARHHRDPLALLQILREVQAVHGWLPRGHLAKIAQALKLPLARIEGVASFYRFLHTRPVGNYRILFSDNITDRMLGSLELMHDLCERLGVQPGEPRADQRVSVDFCSCTGMCDQGPALLINHRHVLTRLDSRRIARIAALIETATPIEAWPAEWFKVQDNIRRADVLLRDRPAAGSAIAAGIARGAPALLDEIIASKLRGRGGAGFATGRKWALCRDAAGDRRHVVCNADEGEPGTFKDRVLLNRDADTMIEGMTIAALAIGASSGLIYLRGEYRYLLESLEDTLQRRRQQGLLGKAIQGQQGFDFDIAVHVGAGSYVCGEESALLESLEGKRGTPRIRPPFPVERGYLGEPTTVNNVETFSAAAHIALKGAAWWSAIGTAQSTGTKLHSISGDCLHPGIYEYPFGTPIARMLSDCGAHDAQAVQVSGPSGTCIDLHEFDRQIAFEDVPSAGALMVFGRSRDMFEVARNFAKFFAHESCGFCTPCRVGTELVVRNLDKLARGSGSRFDADILSELDQLLHKTTHCGLGASACNPLRDTILKFRPTYERRLQSLQFEPAFDIEAELSRAREVSGRGEPAAGPPTP